MDAAVRLEQQDAPGQTLPVIFICIQPGQALVQILQVLRQDLAALLQLFAALVQFLPTVPELLLR